jgi:SAM-dependent methyltransferase
VVDERSSIERNQAYWTTQAPDYAVGGQRDWGTDEVTWGQFRVPEADVGVLPDVAGKDVLEIGCGTAYISAWLARRGAASVVGLDPTPAQLASARRFQDEIGPRFPLVRAAGEQVPLRDGSFDVAVSEYGAAIWADPYAWIPEAARLLRPGGELVFLANSVIFILCAPDEEAPAGRTLVRPQAGLHRVEYTDDEGVEFHLPHGELLRLLRRSGFEVLDLVELYAPAGAADQQYITVDWATKWPMEEIWRVRKR